MRKEYRSTDATVLVPNNKINTPDFPASIMESLVMGKPVIVSDNIYISKIVKKEKIGIVIKPGNRRQLAKAIKELEKNYSKYSAGCTKKAKRLFDIRKKVTELKKIEALLETL